MLAGIRDGDEGVMNEAPTFVSYIPKKAALGDLLPFRLMIFLPLHAIVYSTEE